MDLDIPQYARCRGVRVEAAPSVKNVTYIYVSQKVKTALKSLILFSTIQSDTKVVFQLHAWFYPT